VKATDPALVDLYRFAYNADQPVTFTQLVDAMPSAYQNDANRAFGTWMDQQGIDSPDSWSQRMLRSAMERWVGDLIQTAVRAKQLAATTHDGSVIKGKRREDLLYSANRENPPQVVEQYMAERVVRWTPELGSLGRRHAAGMRFLAGYREISTTGRKATIKELRDLLDLAHEAINTAPTEYESPA
jgi:hypothetical protein